jgi:hypothetical protein
LIPIRLWSTVDRGVNFTDVTQNYFDTQNRLPDGVNEQTSSTANPSGSSTDPFYVDCTTGEFEFTVPTDVAADHKTAESLAYEISVERGGVFTTTNNNTGAQPEFVFQATPIAYDPTNQFNNPGSNGNSQYTPNVKSDKRLAPAPLPGLQGYSYLKGMLAPPYFGNWSPEHPVFVTIYNRYYIWIPLSSVPSYSVTTGSNGELHWFDYIFYYSPDGQTSTAFPA